MIIVAILKHVAGKSADYGAALDYLKYEHDEVLKRPLLDANGNWVLRRDILLEGINCEPELFDVECEMLNAQYHKNQNYDEIKTHHYLISFDPADKDECGLTGEQAQAIGMEYVKANFPGHQALVCTHMDGHNGSGNIHVHIVINSLRKLDVPQQPFMERPIDCKAGYKHHLTKDYLKHLQQSLMNICLRENLNQVDLLSPSVNKITQQEYYAKQRGQINLDKLNSELIAEGFTPMKTKFQTEKDKLRDSITAAAKKAKSFEEFSRLLQTESNILVKDHRGRFSYLLPDREKYISARTLGTSFDREHLLTLFESNAITAAKEKKQWSVADPIAVLYIKSNLRLVVNLQDCVKAQQSRAYAQKVKISNLQQMANTIVYVQQHGYDSYDDLKKARDELSAKMSDARNTAKSTDADLKLLNEKSHYLGQYLSTKATYKEFLQAGNKKMYRSAHQDEIARYEEAVQFLKRNSTNGTIPTMKNLRAEKEKLLSARTAQYESYIYFKDYYHELQTACRNVDMILETEHTQQHNRTQLKRSHEPSL